jgi:hypothetical protein
MKTENQDLFNKFAAVISSRIVEQPSSCYYLHDSEVDLTILKHSIIDKDKNLLYVIRPSGTCLLRCDKYFFRITILLVVEIIKHSFMCILILLQEKRKISRGNKL